MTINPRAITPDRKEQLLALSAGPNAATARRARIVLRTLDGHESGCIAQDLGVNERTVRRVVERYHEGGVEGLQRRSPPGRMRSVSQAEREWLIALIRHSPEEFGIAAPCWKLADLAAIAMREEMLTGVSYWTLRRELARIIQLDPTLQERVSLPKQPRAGAPPGNHNALRHGGYGRQALSCDERALLAKTQADLRRDFPGAGGAAAGLIHEVAVAAMQLRRTINADFNESDMRASLRWRKAIRALKAAAEKPKVAGASNLTPAEWASDLVARYRQFERNRNG